MAQKRKYTQELLKAQAQGHKIVVACGIVDPETPTRQVHVVYLPRHKTDAHPWIEVWGSGEVSEYAIRYSGRECTVANRYVVEETLDGHVVMDVIAGAEFTPFRGEKSFQKADNYAWEANRRHIRKAIHGVEITEPIG